MKNLILISCLFDFAFNSTSMAAKNYDNVISMGEESSMEKINLKLLEQTDRESSEIVNSGLLNFRAESIKDTKRKSFHALRNIEEVSRDEMMIIK